MSTPSTSASPPSPSAPGRALASPHAACRPAPARGLSPCSASRVGYSSAHSGSCAAGRASSPTCSPP